MDEGKVAGVFHLDRWAKGIDLKAALATVIEEVRSKPRGLVDGYVVSEDCWGDVLIPILVGRIVTQTGD